MPQPPSGSDWYQIRTRSGYYITTLERERISGDGIEGMGYTQTNDTRTFIYIIDNIGDGTHSYQLQNRHYVNKEGLVPSYPTTIPHIPLESYTYRTWGNETYYFIGNKGSLITDMEKEHHWAKDDAFDELVYKNFDKLTSLSAADDNEVHQFSKVDLQAVGVKAWRINMENAPVSALSRSNDIQFNYNGTHYGCPSVYNQGYFFLPLGAVPTKEDFSIDTEYSDENILEGMDYNVSIDESASTINVWFYQAGEELQGILLQQVEDILQAGTGIGYPVESERQKLIEARDAAIASPTDENRDRLQYALLAYKLTENVVMPESGKAYRIYAQTEGSATKHTLCYAGRDAVLETTTDADAAGNKAIFVCREIDGQYFFVNGYTGCYLLWRGVDANGNDLYHKDRLLQIQPLHPLHADVQGVV